MSAAHALAFALIPVITVFAVVAALLWQRMRDVFFALTAGAVFSERMDVHFFSEEWYRGTTRGLEISLLAILAFALLVGCIWGRGAPRPRAFWPPSLGPLLAYFLYAAGSVVMSTPKLFGAFELVKMAQTIVVFCAAAFYLRGKREWTLLLVALAFTASLEGTWAVKQRLFTHVDRPPGSLDHPNSLSMYLCLIGPLLVAAAHRAWSRRLRLVCGGAVVLATVGLILTLSRTGLPLFLLTSLGATLACGALRPTPKRLVIAGVVAAAVLVVLAASWRGIKERYEEASLQEEYMDKSGEGRGVYFRLARAIMSDHPFGVGLNNWSYYVSRVYGPRIGFRYDDYDNMRAVYGSDDYAFMNAYLPAPAHDLAALTVGELGVPGLALFLLLWGRWMWLALPFVWRARRSAGAMLGAGIFFSIWGIFGQSVTEWVYRQTPILFTFYVLLGALAAVVHAHRTHPEEV